MRSSAQVGEAVLSRRNRRDWNTDSNAARASADAAMSAVRNKD